MVSQANKKNKGDIYVFLFKQTDSNYYKTTINNTSISQNMQVLGIVIAIFILLFQHQLLEERGKWQKYLWAIFGIYSEKYHPDYIMLPKYILIFLHFLHLHLHNCAVITNISKHLEVLEFIMIIGLDYLRKKCETLNYRVIFWVSVN